MVKLVESYILGCRWSLNQVVGKVYGAKLSGCWPRRSCTADVHASLLKRLAGGSNGIKLGFQILQIQCELNDVGRRGVYGIGVELRR